jgi:hypothetical protein
MRKSKKELQEEFHSLDLMAINGKMHKIENIKRWVKLYRKYYKIERVDNQGVTNSNQVGQK